MKDDYNERTREYKEKAKCLAELDNYIGSTVDRSNHMIIRGLNNPYKKLEPTSAQLKQTARAAYEAAQKWNGRVKLEQWLRNYRNAYPQAQLAQLPTILEYQPHYDFVKAIAQANPACSTVLHGSLVKQEQNNETLLDFS
jgi:hypothetical protein